jgi:hypothetical protein
MAILLSKASPSRCPQCGAKSRDGRTCAERFYAKLAEAEACSRQDVILLAARYALAHPQTHSAQCLSLARAVVQFADARPEHVC